LKVFTSDSFGIGLGLFLVRFVGRYLQFSQIMSVILRRCLATRPPFPAVVVTPLLVFFHTGDTIDSSKVDLVGSGYLLCIHRTDNIASCSFPPEVEIKLPSKYFA
jgi:hypothetical protein